MLHRREVDVARSLATRAADLQPGEAAVDGLVDGRATDRSVRRRSTSARSNFRKAACRPAGSSPPLWPASPPTGQPGCWPSRVPCPAPSSEPCGRRPTGAWGDASAPSGHPIRKRASRRRRRYSNAGQHPSSSCLPVRCSAGVVEQPLRDVLPDCVGASTIGLRRRSGFPRSARSGGRRRAEYGAEFRTATSRPQSGPLGRVGARVFQDRFPVFGRERRRPEPQRTGPLPTAQQPAFPSVFGVGMRQLAGRSVIVELEHKENKCRVRQAAPRKIIRWKAATVGTKPGRSS